MVSDDSDLDLSDKPIVTGPIYLFGFTRINKRLYFAFFIGSKSEFIPKKLLPVGI